MDARRKKRSKEVPAVPAVRLPDAVSVLLAIVAVALLTAGTFIRNDVWQNDVVLWEDTVRKSPNKGRAHHNLGRIYERSGFFNEAFAQYRASVAADPGLARARESLGIAYVSLNRFDLAKPELETAIRLNPDLVQARAFLAYISGQTKQSAKQ